MNLRSVGTIEKLPMGNGWRLLLSRPKENALLTSNAFEGTGWPASLLFLTRDIGSPDGAESEYVKKRAKKKPKTRSTERLTLAPIKFEDALKAMLKTSPPPSSKKARIH